MEHVTVDDWVNFQVAGGKRLVCRMRQVRNYSSFDVMVQDLGIGALLPDFDGDFAAASELYRSFSNGRGSYRELECRHGAVAIEISPLYHEAEAAGCAR